MRPRTSLRAALTALATLAGAAGLVVTAGAAANAAATPLPAHVFAPYFEAYNGDNPATLSQQSGAKYLTFAFIQTASSGSCTAYWNGDTSEPLTSATFGSQISSMQSAGGNAIPSFGGYAADSTSTDIADSCTNVSSIASVYENVISTYNVPRIDLDIEADSLTNTAGINRRNEAVAQTEAWAAANGRSIQFSYTMPSTPSGLSSQGEAVIQNAIADGATVSIVNMMTFDYYIGTTQEMGTDTESAGAGLESQLASLYPSKSAAQLWAMVGVTEMPGVDDYGAAETFTEADATTVLNWAESKGINTISFWALQRDNGGCPGGAAADSCSGISQSTWYFSNTFEPFTSGSTTPPPANNFSVSVSPASGSVTAGSSATATVSTAVTSGSAQSVALTVSGAPSGAGASLSPTSVTAGGNATLTVTTSSSTPAGSYPITVTGTGASGSHSAAYTLTVTGSSGGGGGGGSLTNAGFETGSLSPWTCQAGGAVVGSPVHSGSHALLVAPTASQTGECDQTVTLAANSSHTLTVWVQGNYAFAGVSGGATASTWTSSSGWTELTVPFTTGSSGTVTVYVHGWYSQGNVYADDFSLS